MLQQRDEVGFLFLFVGCDTVEFFKLFRGHLFHFYRGVDDAQDQDGGTDVERVNHRIGYRPLARRIADADKREDEREQITYQAAGIA